MYCLYFICKRKFYACTHVKITQHWKSTLTVATNDYDGDTVNHNYDKISALIGQFNGTVRVVPK